MFPNTFMMQELARRYFDEALDREDEGKEVERPFIYTFARGMKVATRTRHLGRLIWTSRDANPWPVDSFQRLYIALFSPAFKGYAA